MKRIFILSLTILTVMFCAWQVSAYSKKLLTPALTLLSDDTVMIKSAVVSNDIRFTGEDFSRSIGCSVETITITALPPSTAGTLLLGNAPVTLNQTISCASLSNLRFRGNTNCTETSFRFKSGADYSIECVLKFTDSVNLSPVIAKEEAISVWTQCDIATYGTLEGYDPEGDALTFEIVDYPEKGLVRLTNKSTGDYIYTPCDGIVGEDSFSYAVRDSWGNYSDVRTVSVDIDKVVCELVFADMEGHWAHNAALVMASENAIDVRSEGGRLYFDPDREVTREEFLVTVMKSLGAGEVSPRSTAFADDSEISREASGYIHRAYTLGIIKGSVENGELFFNPKDTITRAEAAVILNAIIGEDEPDTIPVFADNASVPAWARSSLYALSKAGILRGTGSGYISPNKTLNRAEVAEILLTIKNLYK